MNFNIEKSLIWSALKWDKFTFLKHFKKLFLIIFSVCFLVFFLGFITEIISEELLKKIFGYFSISFSLFLSLKILQIFFETKIKQPIILPLNEKAKNIADFLSFETAKIIFRAKKRTSSYLFLSVLDNFPNIRFIFLRILLDIKVLRKNLIKDFLEKGEDFEKVISRSLQIAIENKHSKIETQDLLLSLAEIDPFLRRILIQVHVSKQDFQDLLEWLKGVYSEKERFWEKESLRKKGSLAKQWTAGYTITLDKYSIDITEKIKRFFPFIGHEKELKEVENILAKTENNNVLIVGESGSSRKSIVENLAEKSLLGKCSTVLNFKRVVELDINSLVAGTKDSEELEFVLNKIFQETIRAGNIILVMNNFHNYVGQKSVLGTIDISNILCSYLNYSQFQMIAVTDYDGLHRDIGKNSALLAFFEKVEVIPKSEEDALKILLNRLYFFEKKHKVFICFQAIKQIIEMTSKYLPALPFPEKAISVLDETVSSYAKEKIILPKHVSKIITRKTEIPVGDLEEKEKNILLNLEELIHQRLINQEQAVKDIATCLKRARSEISTNQGPMGTFLFLGPTGVGKTETAKSLAEIYFGSENKMIRLDMSEFQETSDIARLIGSEKEPGFLTTQVKENPFSLVLLDELEKANSNIINLFLQVLDEGYLTDGFGRKINFKNTIIIATSNAGYEIILKAIEEKTEWEKVKKQIFDFLFQKGIFRPEFINRFDSVIVFKPLTKENLLDISELLLKKIVKKLETKGIKLVIEKPLKEKIVELSYNPTFGAREMKRVIQDRIENTLASGLLRGDLKKGDKVFIKTDNFDLEINQ
ncbi:MAG: ATP-dependent Clp protease ATP-binding subunit [Candidatus Pacebacteria bacterium]|nr:ATP-dependent Clp protease ATP-binding subunit [Candidatus Paceibacterota bacterium]